MTDYNDGEWHLWDGSFERPAGVHPESLISYVWHNEAEWKSGVTQNWKAGWIVPWPKVLKFRVTKPFRVPRVIWVNEYRDGNCVAYNKEDEALTRNGPHATRIAVRYVEAPE